MTWLHGSTTHTNLQDKLTKLIAGEVADDNGVTVPSGTCWVRDNAGDDFLCTPSSLAYTIPSQKYRAGYWYPVDGVSIHENAFNTFSANQGSVFPVYLSNGQSYHDSYCRVSTVASSITSGTRVIAKITVTTANTTASDYSTLRFTLQAWNADTGASINTQTAQAPNAAGLYTGASTPFSGLQLTFGNPVTGIIPIGQAWVRCFDTTYKGGIDVWPMLHHKQQGASDPGFTTAPPGTVTTDYVIVNYSSVLGNAITVANQLTVSAIGIDPVFSGLGIKTTTGLGSGALYEVNGFACSRGRIRILGTSNAVTAGTVDLEFGGGAANDPFTSTWKRVGGTKVTSWARCFKTPASVVGADTIEYYMSVKADQIVVILQGNPSATALGKLCICGVLALRTDVDTDDKFPMLVSHPTQDYTADNVTSGSIGWPKHQLWDLKGAISPSRDVLSGMTVRDWHTGWSRPELWKMAHNTSFSSTSADFYLQGGSTWTGNRNTSGAAPYVHGDIPPIQPHPHPQDGAWWLYPIGYLEGYMVQPQEVTYVATDPTSGPFKRMYRGATDESVCWLPDWGWTSGDELYESSSGKRWLLLKPDYDGIAQRMRYGSNTFAGGYAILET